MSRIVLLLAIIAFPAFAQTKSYLVKLSTPVNSKTSKVGDPIRAAIISPESLLNGFIEGTIEKTESKPAGVLVLRFTKLLYKGQTTTFKSVLIDWVNSKGHKSVDDEERAVTLRDGELRTAGPELWLDEGSELRVGLINP